MHILYIHIYAFHPQLGCSVDIENELKTCILHEKQPLSPSSVKNFPLVFSFPVAPHTLAELSLALLENLLPFSQKASSTEGLRGWDSQGFKLLGRKTLKVVVKEVKVKKKQKKTHTLKDQEYV